MHISTLISVVLPILGIASAAKDPKAIQQGSESTALTITPLHGSARTGLIDPVTEEGLIAASMRAMRHKFIPVGTDAFFSGPSFRECLSCECHQRWTTRKLLGLCIDRPQRVALRIQSYYES